MLTFFDDVKFDFVYDFDYGLGCNNVVFHKNFFNCSDDHSFGKNLYNSVKSSFGNIDDSSVYLKFCTTNQMKKWNENYLLLKSSDSLKDIERSSTLLYSIQNTIKCNFLNKSYINLYTYNTNSSLFNKLCLKDILLKWDYIVNESNWGISNTTIKGIKTFRMKIDNDCSTYGDNVSLFCLMYDEVSKIAFQRKYGILKDTNIPSIDHFLTVLEYILKEYIVANICGIICEFINRRDFKSLSITHVLSQNTFQKLLDDSKILERIEKLKLLLSEDFISILINKIKILKQNNN